MSQRRPQRPVYEPFSPIAAGIAHQRAAAAKAQPRLDRARAALDERERNARAAREARRSVLRARYYGAEREMCPDVPGDGA